GADERREVTTYRHAGFRRHGHHRHNCRDQRCEVHRVGAVVLTREVLRRVPAALHSPDGVCPGENRRYGHGLGALAQTLRRADPRHLRPLLHAEDEDAVTRHRYPRPDRRARAQGSREGREEAARPQVNRNSNPEEKAMLTDQKKLIVDTGLWLAGTVVGLIDETDLTQVHVVPT